MVDVSDDHLVDAASDLAMQRSAGFPVAETTEALIRAIAMTRDEATRHRLAEAARERAEGLGSTLTGIGLQFLKATLFGLVVP